MSVALHIDAVPDARLARVAGVCYLIVIAGGVFAELGVREALFVPGDAAATMDAIAANESLWRLGIAVHLLYLLPGAAAGVILYRLFRPVGATLALMALGLLLVPIGVETLLLSRLHVPLTLLVEAEALAGLAEGERQALGYLAVRSFFVGWSFALLLFAGFCVAISALILRSRLIPHAIGWLMIAAGAGYVVNSLAGILSPPLMALLRPWVLLPAFIGELSLAVWLTARGVRTPAPEGP
jgi:hypothetical protein